MNTIGNYIILETISVKGPSSVFIARHQKLNRKTFLKVYQGNDTSVIQRFEREAKIVADLNSAAIVQVYDFGEADGCYFISMEFVEGRNLAEYLSDLPQDMEHRLNICGQIAAAVALLHGKGYVHRDLKPENILIDKEGRVKLTDFGLTLHESLKRVTSEGALLGTPLYMSPEQINNTPLAPSSDVFAIGIIFYQLLSGRHPFEAEQYSQVFSAILTHEPPAVQTIKPEIPEWCSDLVQRMLRKDAARRPVNAGGVLHFFPENQTSIQEILPLPEETNGTDWTWPALLLFLFLVIVSGVVISRFFNNDNSVNSDSLQRQIDTVQSTSDTLKADQLPPLTESDEPKPISTNETEHENVNPAAPNTPPAGPTTLKVETFPWCNVYLDYELIDKTPMTKARRLNAGTYVLSLQNPLYPSLSDTIEVLAHKNNLFTYNLDSTFLKLEIQVIPWGKIYIDGQYVRTTPLRNPIYVTREIHEIEIRNPYYHSWRDSIRWQGKPERKLSIELKEK